MFGPAWLGAFGYIAQIANIALDPALHAAPSLLRRSQNGSIPLLTAIDTCLSRYTVNIDAIQPLFDDIENKILGNEEYSDDMRITKVFQRLEAFSATDLSMKSAKPSRKVENSTIEAILSMNDGDSSIKMGNSSMEILDSSMNLTISAMENNNSSVETDFNEDSRNSSTISSMNNQNPSMKFDFEYACGHVYITPEVQIKNFLEIGRFYHKISEIDQILDGNSTIFINDLMEAQKTADERTKIVLQEMVDNLLMDFDKYYEPFHRLKLVVDEIARFSKEDPDNSAFRDVQLGQWGKLSDALNVYAMYRYKGWHWVNYSNPSCSNVLSILKPTINNETLLLSKLQYAYDASLRFSRNFEPFLGLIRREVRDRNESTATELLIHICRILNGFADPGSGRLEEVLEIRLKPELSVKEACECVNVRPPPGYEQAVQKMRKSRLRRFSLLWPFL